MPEQGGIESTRAAGLARLEAFAPRAGRAYAGRRNFDFGPGARDNVSVLSPWIRRRLVTEAEAAQAALSRHGFRASEKFVQEVFWRTYFKGWLEMRPSVWTGYRAEVARLADALERDAGLERRWAEATSGRTGIDCFDFWARELTETGYLHNHARMWFASIWIFTLGLPWALGADFFLRHLLDGDPASNTLGWRWVAGLQTPGKTYLARPGNIARYTDGRFRPEGLAEAAPAVDGPPNPAPMPAPAPRGWAEGARSGLLVTEEDLSPEALADRLRPVSALGFLAGGLSPLPAGEGPRAFAEGGLADARARLAARGVAGPEAPARAPREVVAWAKAEGLAQVVAPYAPVGPAREALDDLAPALEAEGIALVPALRGFDARAWPHATRGFFKFKEKIPRLVEDMQREVAA
jgi:deoxyribodipyrimidine photo-lyase